MASIPPEGIATGRKLHIVMFPWLAFGHIIPYLELSKFIVRKGHKVSFVSTSRNIDRLPKLSPSLSHFLNLVKLSLPRINELPENAEATMDVGPEYANYLKKAYDGLEPQLTQFLEISVPDWIIMDFAAYWLPPVAARLGASSAFFCIVGMWFPVFLGSSPEALIDGSNGVSKPEDLLVPPKWVTFPTTVAFRLNEANRILVPAFTRTHSGVPDRYRVGKLYMGIDCIFTRQGNEFESKWMEVLEQISRRPVIPVGFMPPLMDEDENGSNETWVSIRKWLASQKKDSVVYVALGSEVTLSKQDVTELALGLELSGLPFFWALRKPTGCIDADSVALPDGFEERVKNRGVVWKSWAPQDKILGHDSVECFLSHCGWGSIVEGLTFGHPFVMLPFSVDQGLNARVLVENKVGIEVPRNEQDGSYTRNSVSESLRLVMVENDGKIFKEKAKEMSCTFGDKELNNQYIDNFMEYLEIHMKSAS